MKKLVYFHPDLSFPPHYGSQVSSWEMLFQLKKCGYRIYLFILERSHKEFPLDLTHLGIDGVVVCPSRDKKNVRHSFTLYLRLIHPDIIFMNLPSWDEVLDHEEFSYATRVIYNHHFESVRDKMRDDFFFYWNDLRPNTIEDIPKQLIDPNIYAMNKYQADASEFVVYNQYDYTLAIADSGLNEIIQKCQNTQVIPLKGTFRPQKKSSQYQDFALFPVGTNVFNLQGYYFFIKEILPFITTQNPSFKVHVCGLSTRYYFENPHVVIQGFIDDIYDEFLKARFLICPTFGGTGQQIKILEAMSCALPSVVMFNPWQYLPIMHGKEGFIAQNAKEFAEYCLTLFSDPDLAQKMGADAKKRLTREYHSSSLQKVFRQFSKQDAKIFQN